MIDREIGSRHVGPAAVASPMPDLSHLTEEERKIIESVLQRQREEEEKEQEILR